MFAQNAESRVITQTFTIPGSALYVTNGLTKNALIRIASFAKFALPCHR